MRDGLIIRNGHVIDTAAGTDGVMDVAVRSGRIAAVGRELPKGGREMDASGCFVVPGLIDYHTHLFRAGCALAVDPALLLPMGVTTAVDAGTAGFVNFEAFYRSAIVPSLIKIYAYLSVSPVGLVSAQYHTRYDPDAIDEEAIRAILERHGERILGLKLMMGRDNVGEDPDWALRLLEQTVELAQRLGPELRVVVHATDPPCAAGGIAQRLRAGDIFCHCFHGKGQTILGADGKVLPEIWAARERGVLFDAANGVSHYSHRVAKAAIAQGFLPDIISSDVVSAAVNYSRRNKGLPHLMSKYVNLGLPLHTVLRAVTETPARLLGAEGKLGTLRPGACADIAIFTVAEQAQRFDDFEDRAMTGRQNILIQATILRGELAYRRPDFT